MIDAVKIKWSVCHSRLHSIILPPVVDVFQVYCDRGFRFAFPHLGALRFSSSNWFHVSIRGTSFSLFFSKVCKLLV